MTDWIDTATSHTPLTKSGLVDAATQSISFTDPKRADRCQRQIIEAIFACKTVEDVREYVRDEGLTIDALFLFDPALSTEIDEMAEEHIAGLRHAEDLARKRAKARTAHSVQIDVGKQKMASNPDFKKVVVKNVELQWPRLDQPYRFNEREQKTEPAAATAPGAGYSLAWIMPAAEAKQLWSEMKAHYDDCRARNKKLPAFTDVFSRKKLESGDFQFTAKKGAVSREGTENKPPKVVGPDLVPLEGEDLRIWSGSVGHVRALAFPATNPQDGSGGISFLLDAVQVVKAEYGSDSLEEDFGPAVARDPDFGDEDDAPKAAPKPAPAPAPKAATEDTNIPEDAQF